MVHFTSVFSTAALAALLPTFVSAAPIQSSEEGLVEREPFLPLLGLAAGLFGGRKRDVTEDELAARLEHLADIAERKPEPFLPLLGLAAGLFGGRKRSLSPAEYEDVLERDILDLEELVSRDFDDFDMRDYEEDGMAAREWAELEDLD
ncbi:hypothetical protein BKA70DRAFT_1574792 [Coprinopsis sp. MPI-PUGE-AT-0042]|nr:hypothetical protein BKA70DRAFT_1574792 [Coprinopsis sp. MPI-PUGE-AT-0042]